MRTEVVDGQIVRRNRANLGESLRVAGREFVERAVKVQQVALRGDFFRRVTKDGGIWQPNITVTFVFLTYNAMCYDRRRQGVLTTLAG